MSHLPPRAPARAFTLIELLVSMAVLALMLVTLAQLTNATQRTWTSTVGKIEQFRGARQAFESITRRLSQATLNTYWDYAKDANGNPTAYVRQSELRFISGSTVALGVDQSNGSTRRPTQAIFFQAPLGVVSAPTAGQTASTYHGLDNLLNTWGYCIEFGDDSASRPAFLASVKPIPDYRYRFRLVEFREPSDNFSLYKLEAANGGNSVYGTQSPLYGRDWFNNVALNAAGQYLSLGPVSDHNGSSASRASVRYLADNIVALIILPKLTKEDQTPPGGGVYNDSSLAPGYLYDSASNAPIPANTAVPVGGGSPGDPNVNPKNQLPPVVQVTMVAVDEASYDRALGNIGKGNSSVTMPDFQSPLGGSGGLLFQQVGDTTNPANLGYAMDLQTLQTNLQSYHLNYRVFTTDLSLKAAKWSREQK